MAKISRLTQWLPLTRGADGKVYHGTTVVGQDNGRPRDENEIANDEWLSLGCGMMKSGTKVKIPKHHFKIKN